MNGENHASILLSERIDSPEKTAVRETGLLRVDFARWAPCDLLAVLSSAWFDGRDDVIREIFDLGYFGSENLENAEGPQGGNVGGIEETV